MNAITPPYSQGTRDFLSSRDKKLLLGGAWVPASGGAFPTMDPATGQVLAMIGRASQADLDLALSAARRASTTGPWPGMTPLERAKILWAIADTLEAHVDELSELETLDQGKPLFVSR